MPAPAPTGPTRDQLRLSSVQTCVPSQQGLRDWTVNLEHQLSSPIPAPGPDAPLVLDRSECTMHHEHAFDFHKPAGCHFPEVPPPPPPPSLLPEHVCSCCTLPPRMPARCHANTMIVARSAVLRRYRSSQLFMDVLHAKKYFFFTACIYLLLFITVLLFGSEVIDDCPGAW